MATVIMCVMGAIFVIVPLYGFFWERDVVKNGEETDAVFTKLKSRDDGDGGTTYDFILEYTVGDRKVEAKRCPGIPSLRTKSVGDVIRICYHRERPERIVAIGGNRTLEYVVFGIFFIAGVGTLIKGLTYS
ncbi:MAG: hypothetical protein FWF82_00100 [Oscillospiraceae bacterium]|nr:hypothetical protein [Oscillospiraceae bacterium]